MKRQKTMLWLASGLCLAAFAAGAAEGSASRAAAPAAQPSASRPAMVGWGKDAKDDTSSTRKSRLRYRTADGTCACTCATGGITEEEIRQAQEARERART